jgi:hypothetical protein
MTDRATPSPLDALARYAPSAETLADEWTPAGRSAVLASVVGDEISTGPGRGTVHEIPLHFGPSRSATRRRWSRALPVAMSVAVLAAGAGILIAVVGRSGSGGTDTGGRTLGPAFTPPVGLSNAPPLTSHQYFYRVDKAIDLGANGKPKAGDANEINRNYISATADVLSFRSGDPTGCYRFPSSGKRSLGNADQAFLATLPTEVDALNAYLRQHVEGSSSRDEAVFVVVGDTMRDAAGLATPRLGGAFVGVLSRTPGVTVHQDERDYLGRLTIRADFVDQRSRPGEISSLYFDPSTFRLLEERSGSTGRPNVYSGPSPAYSAPPTEGATTSGALTGAANVDVVTTEKVVAALPTIPKNCGH